MRIWGSMRWSTESRNILASPMCIAIAGSTGDPRFAPVSLRWRTRLRPTTNANLSCKLEVLFCDGFCFDCCGAFSWQLFEEIFTWCKLGLPTKKDVVQRYRPCAQFGSDDRCPGFLSENFTITMTVSLTVIGQEDTCSVWGSVNWSLPSSKRSSECPLEIMGHCIAEKEQTASKNLLSSTQLHSTTLRYTKLHYTTPHHITLHYITLNDTAPQIDR